MGRMWDALRRDDIASSETEQPRVLPAPTEDAEPLLAASEEIPFIEVGPRKSMEASPSVLAYRHDVAVPSLLLRAGTKSDEEPRCVQFRAVPYQAKRSSLAPELVAYHAPNQPAAQQYSDVLDSVLKASAASARPSALLFTSVSLGSGATTALLNAAITAASQLRQRVIVVDANFRRPAVAERLGLSSTPGLREVMAGAVALDEAIQATEQANLFALATGVRTASGVRFVAETLRSLLRQLCQRYPLVFVDGPQWDCKPDVTALGAACDAVFLVVPESEAETPQIDALVQLIPTQGARLAGCILVADL
jgi:Mrp family chromosome partitioning ATPase